MDFWTFGYTSSAESALPFGIFSHLIDTFSDELPTATIFLVFRISYMRFGFLYPGVRFPAVYGRDSYTSGYVKAGRDGCQCEGARTDTCIGNWGLLVCSDGSSGGLAM
jgi:hypothetical protein